MARKTGPRQGSSDSPQAFPESGETPTREEMEQLSELAREAVERTDRAERDISEDLKGAVYADNEFGGDMGARLANLERDVTELKVSLGIIETRLARIETDMLTKGRAAVIALGVVISLGAGGWGIVQQYLSPIVQTLQAHQNSPHK